MGRLRAAGGENEVWVVFVELGDEDLAFGQ
jgi:hypothetical protein